MTKRQILRAARALNQCRNTLLEILNQIPVGPERSAEESRYGIATTADQLYHCMEHLPETDADATRAR